MLAAGGLRLARASGAHAGLCGGAPIQIGAPPRALPADPPPQ